MADDNATNQKTQVKQKLIDLLKSAGTQGNAQQLAAKLESSGLKDLSPEEVQQLQQIVQTQSESQGTNLQVQEIQQLTQTLQLLAPEISSTPVDNIESQAQTAALQEFNQGVQTGGNKQEAVEKATKVAFEQAVQMGASESKAKEAAVKAREAILEQLVEVGDLDVVSEVRAGQIDFSNFVIPTQQVETTTEPAATDQAVDTQTESTTIDQSTETTTNVETQTSGAEETFSAELNETSATETTQTVESEADVLTNNSLSTQVITQTLGGAAEVSNSQLMGSFVSQEVSADGTVQAEQSELAQLQQAPQDGQQAVAVDDVGQGEVAVDLAEPTEVEVEQEAPPIQIEVIPPTEVSVMINDVGTDPDGESAIFTFEITKEFVGNPTDVRWEIDGDRSEDIKALWPTKVESFAADEKSKIITVEIPGENLTLDEVFTVRITPEDKLTFIVDQGEAETHGFNLPANLGISASSVEIVEGDQGSSQTLEFTVSRDRVGGQSEVDWIVQGVNAQDFANQVLPSGTVHFEPGETHKTLQFQLSGDRRIENDENLEVQLGSPGQNLALTQGNSVADTLVINDDARVEVVAGASSALEDATNFSTTLSWEINRTNTLTATTVEWEMQGEFRLEDVGGEIPSGILEFAAGESKKVLEFTIPGDELIETDQLFSLKLTQAGENAVIDPANEAAEILFHDDDIGFNLLGVDTVQLEKNLGEESTFTFRVIRSGLLEEEVSINYKLLQLGDSSAAPEDFSEGQDALDNGLPSGTVTFAPGETEKLIEIRALGDNSVGGDEQFAVVLADPPAGTKILMGTSSGILQDNDATVNVVSVVTSQLEGNTSDTVYTLGFEREGYLNQEASFQFRVLAYGDAKPNSLDFPSQISPSNVQTGLVTGEVIFAEGENSATAEITVKADSILEGHETFQVEFFDPVGATVFGSGTVFTIRADEAAISLGAVRNLLLEGNDSGSTHEFVVTRSGYLDSEAIVDWQVQTANEPSVDAQDFGGALPSGTLTFAPGETTKTITFTPSTDLELEDSESYTLSISPGNDGVVILKGSVEGLVANDDDGFSVLATDLSKSEGDSDPTTFTFQVDRSGYLFQDSTVDWRLVPADSDGVATDDFEGNALPSGTLEFSQGQKIKTVTFQVAPDTTLETDEGFSIVLENPSAGSTLIVSSVEGSILNDDAVYRIGTEDTEVLEGQEGSTTFTYTITREGSLDSTDTVDYIVSGTGENAATEDDFTGNAFPTGTVEFDPGEASRAVEIQVAGDEQGEENEDFQITLQNPSLGTAIVDSTAQSTILNDDDDLAISAQTSTVTESDDEGVTFTYVVNRTQDLSTTTTVDWAVTGSGEGGVSADDFVGGALPSGTLSFGVGEDSKTITFQASGDNSTEGDEGLSVTLSNPSKGTSISQETAEGTLQNDDSSLTIAAATNDLVEGTDANSTHEFTVTRAGKLDPATTVTWTLSGTGEDATDANDFTATTGTISFDSGETTKTISVEVAADAEVENDETYEITLSDPTAGDEFLTATSSGTVRADDAGLSIAADSATVVEGAGESTKSVTFTVTRTGNLSSTATADWAVSGDVAAADFFGGTLPSGSVSFAADVTSQTITLTLAGDNSFENNEDITVTLSNANEGTVLLQSTASTTVENDDSLLTFTEPAATITEGDDGTVSTTYTVTRTGDTSSAITVDYLVTGTGDNPARLEEFSDEQDELGTNNDFPSGTLSFDADETSKEITIYTNTDGTVEEDETFQISLTNASSNTDISTASATTSIQNDDTGVSITALEATKSEGDSGNTTITFEVVRGGDVSNTVDVDYAVSGDVDGDDFGGSLPSGTLTFAPDEKKKTLELELTGDETVETDEDLTVTISNAVIQGTSDTVTIVDSAATTSITNEDESFAASADTASAAEGNEGSQNFDYTITRSGDLSKSVTIDYAIAGDGVNAEDIQASSLPSGTFTFAADETTKEVQIFLLGDDQVEADEEFTLTISNPSEGIISNATATSTATNDDMSFGVAADDSSKLESHSGSTDFTFTVTRNGNTSGTATVDYAVSGGDNLNGTDFTGESLPSGTVSFADGEASKTLTIQVSGDTTLESDEDFTVTLSNPSKGILDSNATSAETTISTDDDQVAIAADQTTVAESHTGTTNLTFTITRTDSTTTQSTVDYTVSGMDADDFADGTDLTGTVSFEVGDTSKTITLPLKGDTEIESDETVTITLSDSSTGTTIETASATTDVTNDDAGLSISTLLADKDETNTGSSEFTFTVTRSGFINQSNTVEYRVTGTGDDATDSSDFSSSDTLGDNSGSPSGTVSFSANDTSETITINVSGDSSFEADEDFTVTLSNPSTGAIVTSATASGQIDNDDALINFAATTNSQEEVDSGSTSTYTYTINRTGNTTQTSTIDWALNAGSGFSTDTVDGSDLSSIVADGDSTISTSGTITFASGETSKTLDVKVKGDNTVESDKGFTLTLSSPSTGTELGDSNTATGTVVDDDTYFSFSTDNSSQPEGSSGTTTYTYTVTRTGRLDRTTSFDWAIGGYDPIGSDDAASSSDFDGSVFPSGSVSFSNDETTKTITFDVAGDITIEDDEWFQINPSNVVGAEDYETSERGEIQRDEGDFDIIDAEVTAIGDPTTITSSLEGEEGDADVVRVFAVHRDFTTIGTPSFEWRVTDTAGYMEADLDDFVTGDTLGDNDGFPSGTASFADGEEYAYFTITTSVDDLGEDDEAFDITISNATSGNQITDSLLNATSIRNDDPLFKPVSTSVNEGTDDGTTPVVVTVTRTGDTVGEATVDWALSFSGTETTNEGNNDTGTWYKAESTDIDGGDPTSGTLSWADGESEKTLTFNIDNDSLTETYQEDFSLTLSNAVDGTNSDSVGISDFNTSTITIVDDEGDPEVTITADADTILEGTGGTTQFTYTITRTDVTDRESDPINDYPTTVYWSRPYDTDISGSWTGYITIPAGDSSATLTLDIASENDDIESDIGDVTVTISLTRGNTGSGPAKLGDTTSATTTVLDDDIRLWAEDISVVEGDSGTTDLSFTVTRRGYEDTDVSFDYAFDADSGTAEAEDFTGTTSGTLTIPSGETSKTFTLPGIVTDTDKEGDETFQIDLSNPTAGALFHETSNISGSSTHSIDGSIEDDDTPFHVNVKSGTSSSLVETDSGQTQSFNFTITRDSDGDNEAASVEWRVVPNGDEPADISDFTTSDAIGDNDGFPSGTVSFAENDFSEDIAVLVTGDLSAENDEGFKVVISNPNPGKVGTAEATATILTDDTGISIADATDTAEGDSGTTNMTFTVTRSGDLSVTSTMDYAVTNLTSSDSDFSGSTTGSLSFAADDTEKTITITLQGDTDVENYEDFKVVLSNFAEVDEVIDFEGSGTIQNDESNFSITATDSEQKENDGGHTFTITRDKSTAQDQVIRYTVEGTEVDTTDFGGSFPTGTVTFEAGELSKIITINGNGDGNAESDEAFDVVITDESSSTGVIISSDDTASGKLLNDDAKIDLSVDPTTRAEGNSNENYTFTIVRSGDTTGSASIEWKVTSQSDGLDTDDFADGQDGLGTNAGFPSGTVNFADGESEKTVSIELIGDLVVEADDTFRITLQNPTGAELDSSTEDVVLTNDDATIAIAADAASAEEGNSETTDYTFTITRTGNLSIAGTVDYAVTGTTGLDGTDFDGGSLPSGTLTLPSDQDSVTLTISVKGDTSMENNEDFTVTLTNPSSGIVITTDTATSTITTDDVQFDVSGPTTDNLSEMDENEQTDFVFTITRSGDLRGDEETVDWAVAGSGDNPLSEAEFLATTGSVTFAADETSKEVTISVLGDLDGEVDESFTLTITPPDGSIEGTMTATATVVENEASLVIAADQSSVDEGSDTATSTHTFTVTRTGDLTIAATADWAVVANGDLTADDFSGGILPSGTVEFAADETTKTISIEVQGDHDVEADEDFTVTLSNPSANVVLKTDTATSTIANDDSDWSIATDDTSKDEGDSSGSTTFTYTVTRTGETDRAATIDYAVTGSGTNAAGESDFSGSTLPSGTLNFAAGDSSKTITVELAPDDVKEEDEEFTVTISNPTGDGQHEITTATASSTIANDDDIFSITADSTPITEPDTDSTAYTFTVTRDGDLDGTSTVGWRIKSGSDTDSSDFDTTGDTLSFADGEDSKEVTIQIQGDLDVENDEAFTVELHDPGSGSTLSGTDFEVSSQINNNDIDLTIAADESSVLEGDTDGGVYEFTVTRTGDLSGSTTVDWALVNDTTSADDFAAEQDGLGTNDGLPSGTLSFAADETSKTIQVQLSGDGDFESDENFQIQLSNPSGNAQTPTASASGTIANDDDQLSIAAADANKNEGEGSAANNFDFTVNRTGSSEGEATVTWTVTGSGERAATDDDFSALTGQVQFADGESSKTINIEVIGDELGEYDEGFTVTLSDASLGSTIVTSTATGEIINDDPVLFLSSDTSSILEDATNGILTYTITRSGDLTSSSSVDFRVEGFGNDPAAEDDFGGFLPSGTIVFDVGDSVKSISVPILTDTNGEFDETFTFQLENAQGADILEGSTQTTLLNDDTSVALQAESIALNEGDDSGTEFQFTVTRTGILEGSSTVDWEVVPTGSIFVDGEDFQGGVLPTGSLSFAADESEKTITFSTVGDSFAGADEPFLVKLTNPVDTDIIREETGGTILNDDSEFSVLITDNEKLEGNSGSTDFLFTVIRTGNLELDASVDYRVDGLGEQKADAGDFVGGVLPTGTVSFSAGESEKTVIVSVVGDMNAEATESFRLNLENPSINGFVKPQLASADAVVITEDTGVYLVAENNIREEGTEDHKPFTYEIRRVGDNTAEISVTWSIEGTGANPVDSNDFITMTGTVVLAAGENTAELRFLSNADSEAEADETFNVVIDAENVDLIQAVSNGVLANDDTGYHVTTDVNEITEGTGSDRELEFEIFRTGSTDSVVSVDWKAIADIKNPVDGDDFGGALPEGTVEFAEGENTKSVSITLSADVAVESDEIFSIDIGSNPGLTIVTKDARVKILDDDQPSANDEIVTGTRLADTLEGLGGDDELFGLEGIDILTGGEGADRFRYTSPGEGNDQITDFEIASDRILYRSDAFGGLTGDLSHIDLNATADLAGTLSSLSNSVDSDVYRISFENGVFDFSSGTAGNLDELEAAFTTGDHSGAAFIAISDESNTQLYFDADTAIGTDGSGLMELATLQNVEDATELSNNFLTVETAAV